MSIVRNNSATLIVGDLLKASSTLSARFWNKVDKVKEGCWLWNGAVNEAGYGVIARSKEDKLLMRAHRVMWLMAYGSIPDGLHVLHHCDVPRCVRPSHLFTGTDADNQHDKWAKGRGNPPPVRRGKDNNKTKLTTTDVREIRKLYEDQDCTQRELGILFDVDRSQIGHIVNGEHWRWLT